MLGTDPFYFSINRKMTAAFGTLFNEIVVPRFDANGAITEILHVPISYAPKERVEAREIDDPNIDKQSAISPLPRISFEMQAPTYDADRTLNPIQTMSLIKDNGTKDYKHQFEAVPYDFHYTLWIYAKTIEDGNKIFEQIVPFFKPEFPLKINLIPEMNVIMNIPVILNSSGMTDTYEGDFKGDRRAIIWTLDFTMKGYYFGPITEDKVIKFANVNFYAPTIVNLIDAVGNSAPVDRVTAQPGLTANGVATSNIALTIPYQQISADDPYGYIDVVYGNLDRTEGTGGNPYNNLMLGGGSSTSANVIGAAATASAGIVSVTAAYLGQVATRSYIPQTPVGGLQQMMSRSYHFARDTISSMQLVLYGESTSTHTTAIEYPVGTFTQVKFGGAVQGTFPVGGMLVSDSITVSIPKNSKFFVRQYHVAPTNNGITTTAIDTTNGDSITYGASGVIDQTMGGTVSNSGGSVMLYPAAIIGMTKLPSVYCTGDSRCRGLYDTPGDTGEIAQSIAAAGFAYINGGRDSQKAQSFGTLFPNDATLMNYCSHVINQMGINDLNGGRTSAQILADLQSMRNLAPTKPWYQCTIIPDTTSTDSWVTTANQTVVASNAQHVLLNQAIRAVPSWATGIFDTCSALESSQDSGLWAAPPIISTDGLHENPAGYALIRTTGKINTSLIHWP